MGRHFYSFDLGAQKEGDLYFFIFKRMVQNFFTFFLLRCLKRMISKAKGKKFIKQMNAPFTNDP